MINIENILHHLDLQESMSAVEFGCGSADFTIALARKLSKGSVYALDIQEEKLSALKGKLLHQKVGNVKMIHCDLEAPKGSTLKEASQDVVLIPNVLFQAENKHAMIMEAVRILKSGGELLIIDWFKNAPHGPKETAVDPQDIKKMVTETGLTFKKEWAAGDYHFALLFIKN